MRGDMEGNAANVLAKELVENIILLKRAVEENTQVTRASMEIQTELVNTLQAWAYSMMEARRRGINRFEEVAEIVGKFFGR